MRTVGFIQVRLRRAAVRHRLTTRHHDAYGILFRLLGTYHGTINGRGWFGTSPVRVLAG